MRDSRGFTLLELMLVLAIVVILASIAMPSFERWLQAERVSRSVNQLQAVYHFARSEAVKREQTIELTASAAELKVKLTGDDGDLLRQLQFPSQLILQLANVELQATGQVGMPVDWQVHDPRGLVTDRCIRILPSGQLRVIQSSCPS